MRSTGGFCAAHRHVRQRRDWGQSAQTLLEFCFVFMRSFFTLPGALISSSIEKFNAIFRHARQKRQDAKRLFRLFLPAATASMNSRQITLLLCAQLLTCSQITMKIESTAFCLRTTLCDTGLTGKMEFCLGRSRRATRKFYCGLFSAGPATF